jgi:UPF0716 family protein affecting phage T7 exclusion
VIASIGFAWALALMLATTIAGLVVLRSAGRGRLALFRGVATDTGISGIAARIEANLHGFFVILGGILLVLPGFITDVIGALFLLAPIRQWCGQRPFAVRGPSRRSQRRRDRSSRRRMPPGCPAASPKLRMVNSTTVERFLVPREPLC